MPGVANALTIPIYHFEVFQPLGTYFTLGLANWCIDVSCTIMIFYIPVLLLIMLIQRS
jgi:hypothetical protein